MSKILLSVVLASTLILSACNNKNNSQETVSKGNKEVSKAEQQGDVIELQSVDLDNIPPLLTGDVGVAEGEVVEAPVESQGDPLFIAPQCPKISSNFNKALSDLKKIKNDILSAAGCETIADATVRLEEVVSDKRKVYEGVLKKYKKGEMLSGKEATLLEAYATQVSETAANIFDLMEITDCSVVKKKKKLIAKSLLGITFDAVGGLSEFLGPYGAPLSIGITALKGVVNGLFNHSEKNSGFKFSVSEEGRNEAQEFTKKLCLFYNFKKEADVLLNASDRRDSYLNLITHLNNKIDSLTSPGFCNGCETLSDLVESYESISPVAEQLVSKINAETRLNLGTHMLDALQTRLWVKDQMEKLEIEEDSFQESIGPAVLGAELEDLENFLIYRESTDFMSWINDETSSAYNAFSKHADKWTSMAYTDLISASGGRSGGIFNRRSANIPYPVTSLRKMGSKSSVTLYEFKEMLLEDDVKLPKTSRYNDNDLVVAEYNKSIKVLKNVNRFIGSHNEYCNFFKLAGYYDAIYSNCNNREMGLLNDAFLLQTLADPELSGYLQADKEAQDRVSKMTNGLEEWSKHLDKLFGKWNRVHNMRIQSFIRN